MYDMYPEAWTAAEERRPALASAVHPRRRARKAHSVLPPVLTAAASVAEPVRSAS